MPTWLALLCAQGIAYSVTVKGDNLLTPGTLTFENTYPSAEVNKKMAWTMQPRAISTAGATVLILT